MTQMATRQDPVPDIPAAEKEEALSAVEELLSSKWLAAPGEHSMKSLWRRSDFLATIELILLGKSILLARGQSARRLLTDCADDLKGDDYGNRVGTAFELFSALQFNSQKHPVVLAAANQKGYDFTIKLPKGRYINVSCKALIQSSAETRFRSVAKTLTEVVGSTLPPGLPANALFVLHEPSTADALSVSKLRPTVENCVKDWVKNPSNMYGINGWTLQLAPLASFSNAPFFVGDTSYSVTVLAPFMGDEQRRFEEKLKSAISNLSKHSPSQAGVSANAIIVKIPSSISFGTAREYVQATLDASCSEIGAVFLYKSDVITAHDLKDTSVAHQLDLVENKNAKVPMTSLFEPGFQLDVSVPIGRVISEDSRTELRLGAMSIDISKYYSFVSGKHVYHQTLNTPGATFTLNRVPSISTTYILDGLPGGQLRMDFKLPPSDELVVL